jgi:hypothetical protein
MKHQTIPVTVSPMVLTPEIGNVFDHGNGFSYPPNIKKRGKSVHPKDF